MTLTIINNKINSVPSQAPVNRDQSSKLKAINTTWTAPSYSVIPVESLKAYTIGFSARKQQPSQTTDADVSKIVKSVKGKKYQGEGLYIPEGKTKPTTNIQWQKVTWENLQKEPINWKTAKKEDVLAFWHALSLCEVKETSWVNKYNPHSTKTALSTGHAISSSNAKVHNNKNLQALEAIDKKDHAAFLDKPLIDTKTGKFAIDFTVFDTETTGVGDNDKIIQIGAIQYKDGKEIPYMKYFDPEMEIPQGAIAVHHIDKKVLEENKAKPIKEELKSFTENVLGNNLLVGYNAQFDINKLNHEIDLYNPNKRSKKLKKKENCLTLDPMLIMQRIHPFVGVRKKLGEQYKFFFGKGFDGAHDAFNDVKATVDVLKYSALYLNKHFTPTPDKKELTVRDLLTFQFGGKVKGLNIGLSDELSIDKTKTYAESYTKKAISADEFSNGCSVNDKNFEKLEEEHGKELGEKNLNTIKKLQEAMLEMAIHEAPKRDQLEGKIKIPSYSPQSLKRVLNSPEYKIEDNNGKSSKELIKLICEKLPNPKSDFMTVTWMKNIDQSNPKNDLPDMEIARQVMLDKPPALIKSLVKRGTLPDLSKKEQPERF